MIRPLHGYVVRSDAAERVAAPAAGHLSPAQIEELIAANPDSCLQLFGDTADARRRGRRYLDRVTTDGTFLPTDGWWIYQISEDGHTQTGVVGEVSVSAYESDRVLRHEHTVAAVASRVADTLEAVGGSAHPVSLLYRHRSRIDENIDAETTRPPDISIARRDRMENAWKVQGADALAAALDEVPTLYIADGHHRSAGAAALAHRSPPATPGAGSHFLVVIFPDDQMKTLSFHRCLHLLDRSPQRLRAAIAARLDLRPMAAPQDGRQPDAGEVWGVVDHEWFSVRLPEATGDGPTSTLDAARLQHQILGPMCDVADPRADPRLSYVPGGTPYTELATICSEEGGIAFVTRAAGVEDVMAVSDAGGIMPPKSTWFTPKIGAGLFLRRLVP